MAQPVNRGIFASAIPAAGPSQAAAGADTRLYLRDQDLDQGAALIRAAARQLTRLAQSGAVETMLSGPELDVILEIHDRGPLDVGELRTRLDAPKQSLARNLNELETRGLIVREASLRDRRRRLVTLTPAGADLAARATERRRAALRAAFLTAGPDAVGGARRVLGELANPDSPGWSNR